MKKKILTIIRQNRRFGAGIRRNGIIEALEQYCEVIILDPVKEFKYSKTTNIIQRVFYTLLSFINFKPHWAPWLNKKFIQKFTYKIENIIKSENIDCVLFVGPDMLPNAYVKLSKPVIIDIDDIYSLKKQRSVKRPIKKKFLQKLNYWLTKEITYKQEKHIYDQASQLWVCSEVDAERIKKTTLTPVHVIPNFTRNVPKEAQDYKIKSKKILFLGTLVYHANLDGISWFVNECWSYINAKYPDWLLQVVGEVPKNFKKSTLEKYPNVEVTGFVQDLEDVFKSTDIFICPIHIAGGTRIKILEAWSWGLPVVSTTVGIEGLAGKNGVNALISEDTEQIQCFIDKLINDEVTRKSIGKNGQKHWDNHFKWDIVSKKIGVACNQILTD